MRWNLVLLRPLRNAIDDLRKEWAWRIWYKRRAPNTVFPVRNEATGRVVWFETNSTLYGVYVTIHREKPRLRSIQDWSLHTGMSGVHIDYYVSAEGGEEEVEQIKLQLYDASVGPYADDARWEIPADYDLYHDASIILVPDVQAWKSDPEDLPQPKKKTWNQWPHWLRWRRRIAA